MSFQLSKDEKSNIYKLNALINKAVKEIKIANARAESAEKVLQEIRVNAQSEIQKAFDEGYKQGCESASNNSGSKDKDDVKLKLDK